MERRFDSDSVCISFVILLAILETCSTQNTLQSTSPKTHSTTPPSRTEGTVRLLYGSSRNEGRVEVYWKSNWYAVCSESFDILKQDLVCRQLGYSAADPQVLRFGYGEGDILFSVVVDNTFCTGYESSLLECDGVGLREYECSRNQIAGVTCSTLLLESTTPSNTVRLVDSSLPHAGRVEVYYNGFWATVCDVNWHYKESNVVCKQLGFIGAASTYYKPWVGRRNRYPILGRLECDGTELQWTDCSAYDWNVMNCGSSNPVGVNCIAQANDREGDVRLVGTSSKNAGRVEIYHQGQWGTICDDGWNIYDAEVVCRQLGFPGALLAVDNAFFGQGNVVMLLDDVSCSGTEQHLLDCRHSGWYQHNCGPGDEAGVQCNMPDVHYLRLTNGSKPCEGRVEIWNGDQWSKVCSQAYFNENEAYAVCEELGFDEVEYLESDDRFGHGYGPPSEVDYWCSEDQDSLSQCTIHPLYDGFCETVVLGCKKRDSPLSSIAIWGIAIGATIVAAFCFGCIYNQCKSHKSCERTDSRADPNGQIDEGPSVISMNVNEDAPPAYNDVVDSHV